MKPLTTLFDESSPSGQPVLPKELRACYGGDLSFMELRDRPYVVANFVSTLDGVVSYDMAGKAGGGPVSNFKEQDAFVMGLLRAYADAVVVGAGTLHGDSGHVRTASFVFPAAERMYDELRGNLKKSGQHPINVIVSGSGRVDLCEPTFHTPSLRTVVVTSLLGRTRLEADYGSEVTQSCVRTVADGPSIAVASIVRLLSDEFGVRLLLLEGGPTLFSGFLRDGYVDELFLTVAPSVAGRSNDDFRPSFTNGIAFSPEDAPRFELLTAKRSRSHLFLRYRAQRQPSETTIARARLVS